jgi:hypothetical protein
VSRFDGILKAKGRGPAAQETPEETPPAEASPDPSPVAPPSPAPRKGRPPGKRSNPAFEQVTAYIPGDLYRKVRIGLLEDAKGQEFSELVADLLSAWLAGRKSG